MIFYVDKTRLRDFLAEMTENVRCRTEAARSAGAEARRHGAHYQTCPYEIDSWMGCRWLEGWSGMIAPEREVVLGGAFNMTPAEEIFGRITWAGAIGLSAEDAARIGRACQRGYRPDAITGNA